MPCYCASVSDSYVVFAAVAVVVGMSDSYVVFAAVAIVAGMSDS